MPQAKLIQEHQPRNQPLAFAAFKVLACVQLLDDLPEFEDAMLLELDSDTAHLRDLIRRRISGGK